MLKGKTIVLGVSGGIAAYKACELTRRLVEAGAEVHVMMTRAAQEFVTPLTFQTLSGHSVHTNLFSMTFLPGDRCADDSPGPPEGEIARSKSDAISQQMRGVGGRAVSSPDFSEPSGLASGERIAQEIGHISLADRADAIVIAPATADLVAKIAHGICDDLITTVLCATRAPVFLSPSMNVQMWENPITQENVERLRRHGYLIIEPESGSLACGYEGKGRLPEPQTIIDLLEKSLSKKIRQVK